MSRKVIVAVHGVGDQIRFATIRQVLTQFCGYHGEVASVPLGSFHTDTGSSSLGLTSSVPPYPQVVQDLAFSEVYWADIAREIANKKYELEDVKPWVQTIIGRVRRRKLSSAKLENKEQHMLEEVLGEMLQTVGVLDRLCFLADKMGLFSFDLKRVLTDFVSDVQIVAEFKSEGRRIGDTFAKLMDGVHKDHPGAEIYLVAHSEGTVVTLLGLLSALCGPADKNPWIKKVRGFMTLGSPIDKHLILWPELFATFKSPNPALSLDKPIEWRNYYDHGDPVGFELDTARARFAKGGWSKIFNFEDDHDYGFTRYPFPGKAHVDYWEDADVFGHFIQTVVYKDEELKPKPDGKTFERPPATKPLAWVVSWIVPYLGAALLLFCGVLVLYKAIPGGSDRLRQIFADVGSVTLLLAGVTVAARIPRLTHARRWHLGGVGIFLAFVLGHLGLPCLVNRGAASFVECCRASLDAALSSSFGLLGIAAALLLVSLVAGRLRPDWGMATLLVPGVIAIAVAVSQRLGESGDLWPIFLAGAFFLYVWWLAALVFDLIFVWHRYIRHSKEGQYLKWQPYEEPGPAPALPKAATA